MTTLDQLFRGIQERARRDEHAPPTLDYDASLDLIHQDLSLIAGIMQAQLNIQARIYHPFAYVIASETGGQNIKLYTAPALQRVQLTQIYIVSSGAGGVSATVTLTGEAMGLNGTVAAYASLAANTQVPIPDIELPAGATINISTAGGISGSSLQVCWRYCVLENNAKGAWDGRRA